MSPLRLPLLVLCAFGLLAQTAESPLNFEVASVRRTSGVLPDGRVVVGMLPPTGGPGTNDPGRIRYPAISLKTLLLKTFNVQDGDLRGPSWLDDEFFEVNALMPPDTTPEQFRAMLRNLLSERFKLTVHRESKPTPGYILVIAKNGPKLKASETKDMIPDDKWVARAGKDGFIVPRQGQRWFMENGRLRCRWTYQHATMEMLVGGLTMLLGGPVRDATALTKEYDFRLTFRTAGTSLEERPGFGNDSWSPGDRAAIQAAADIPDIFGAVQLLGLKLERNRLSEHMIVIDHIEKSPTAN